jgi:hypothetical protein
LIGAVLPLPAYSIILVLFIAAMTLWVLAVEFWPRKQPRDDGDDSEPALVT